MTRSELGKIVLIEIHAAQTYKYEILDGKQRLNAFREFITGQFKYKGYFHWELAHEDRIELVRTPISVANIKSTQITEVEKLELFIKLNAARAPQTEEHLSHVKRLLEQARLEEALNAKEKS